MDYKYNGVFPAEIIHFKNVSGDKMLEYAKKKGQEYEKGVLDPYTAVYNNCTTVACKILRAGNLNKAEGRYVFPNRWTKKLL